MSKGLGKCPWCSENVRARIIEENYVRRDLCVCPQCGEKILVCRTPGCSNYAKGGEFWDDELCPDCTSDVGSLAVTIGVPLILGKVDGILKK